MFSKNKLSTVTVKKLQQSEETPDAYYKMFSKNKTNKILDINETLFRRTAGITDRREGRWVGGGECMTSTRCLCIWHSVNVRLTRRISCSPVLIVHKQRYWRARFASWPVSLQVAFSCSKQRTDKCIRSPSSSYHDGENQSLRWFMWNILEIVCSCAIFCWSM